MTAKEKAEELFELFTFSCRECDNAKESASRAVDEVIKANPYKWVPFMDQYTETVLTSNIQYWQEVKQELEKIGDNK